MNRKIKNILRTIVCLQILILLAIPVIAIPGIQNKDRHIPVCKEKNGEYRCHSRVVVDSEGQPLNSAGPSGYTPANFLSAYNLNGKTTTNQIIAIVDAFNDPNIASDLATYSNQFGLQQLGNCPVSSGSPTSPCFQKVDQRGGTNYPRTDSGWALEIALDVEIAHAICQNCNILLVEADSNSFDNLAAAFDRAAIMGANVISNSYGAGEFSGETSYDNHYNIQGIAITFSSGDSGFGTEYPAASPFVTAVGGTTLNLNPYSETVWSGTGSGCSSIENKPSFQTDTGCSKRTIADVSADADPNTGAAIYDTVRYFGRRGWFQVGGTSLSSPIIAGVYALGGGVSGYGNSIPYARYSPGVNLNDIVSGSNGNCGTYLCNAVPLYDGPTGLGTPISTGAFH